MIAFRFNKNTQKAKDRTSKKLSRIDGVFRIVSAADEGFAELAKDASHKRVAKSMKDIKNISDIEIFDFTKG